MHLRKQFRSNTVLLALGEMEELPSASDQITSEHEENLFFRPKKSRAPSWATWDPGIKGRGLLGPPELPTDLK